MTYDLASALRRATKKVRAAEPLDTAAIIQAALGAAGLTGGTPGTAPSGMAASQADGSMPDVSGLLARLGAGGTLPGASTSGTPMAATGLAGLRRASVGVPDGARWETRSYASAAGARDYRLYVPAHLPDGPQGLVLMLHGCKQNPDDFALGTRMNALAEAHGLILAYPHQPGGANVSGCWNWFDPAHQARGHGEPAILAGIAGTLAAEFAVPQERVFAAGLSAGGAMALVLATTYPDVVAAAGVHSGLPYASAHDVASAFAAMRSGGTAGSAAPVASSRTPRLIVLHGTADRTVAPANAEAIVREARRALPPVKPRLRRRRVGGRDCTVGRVEADGRTAIEAWSIEGAGHAWSGGSTEGSFADPAGPDASAEMVRFFLAHEADGGGT